MRDSSPADKEVIAEVAEDDSHPPRLNDISKKFIADCIAEKEQLGVNFPLAAMLFDEAIDRVYATGRIPGREMYADVFKQKLIKVSQKVFVPVKQFPTFNFNGKILGPKGNSLRNLQKKTQCRILIKGRNSVRDPKKEEELRESGDPRHAHLKKDLYVEISTVSTPAEAHARLAYALAEIRKYLIPDGNDEVIQSQRKEMLADPEFSNKPSKFLGDMKNKSSKKTEVSILQKITGRKTLNAEMDFEEDAADEEHTLSYPAPRSLSQRPPVKRSLTEAYFQRNDGETDIAERQAYRGQGSTRPLTGILKKVSRYEDDDEEEEYDPYESGYDHKSRDPIRQRPPPKRFFPDQPSYIQQRYENPQKRIREMK